ncbi:CAAD domain-containing protein [Leptolyngbya sp. FACHB-261]|uniref:CAAD domain-containing protein n=1 Tax=Leptolyngbya sp. FACHB-261 TaxID=2692806 RepID=UPI0016859336|nr:CAAD domain-containing protein [Leptolyngbya sp. FACHB-261]MBD2103313.1 CAAD domain-containing protein [Leptolyngbya sp. FACHB-261]
MSVEEQNTEVLDLPGEAPVTTLTKLPPATSTQVGTDENQWQRVGERLAWLTSDVPRQIANFLDRYQTPVKGLGIIALSIPFVVFTAALLRVIAVVPLLAPTLELVGFGYSAWFVYRYLLFADRRQELGTELDQIKGRVWGQDS